MSKWAHCAQLWRSAWQRAQVATGLQADATDNSSPQRTHLTTSRKPGMLNVFGWIGGWPRGAYSFLGGCGPRSRGSDGSSLVPSLSILAVGHGLGRRPARDVARTAQEAL